MPNRMKLDRETLGGLADMFGQMPGEFITCQLYLFVEICAMSSSSPYLFLQVVA